MKASYLVTIILVLATISSSHAFSMSIESGVLNHKAEVAERIMAGSNTISIVGFGSLLSEISARSTFPDLENFRYARIKGFRRIFTHPAPIFFERGIAVPETQEFSSLSVQPDPGAGFVGSVFEITGRATVEAFVEREIEYDFAVVPYYRGGGGGAREEEEEGGDGGGGGDELGRGVMCSRFTDEGFIARYGEAEFENSYGRWGINTIWNWGPASGILPCPVYLRHCVLAAQKQADFVRDSFLDETYLADCKTTIREYLELRPDIMTTLPPDDLIGRYSG